MEYWLREMLRWNKVVYQKFILLLAILLILYTLSFISNLTNKKAGGCKRDRNDMALKFNDTRQRMFDGPWKLHKRLALEKLHQRRIEELIRKARDSAANSTATQLRASRKVYHPLNGTLHSDSDHSLCPLVPLGLLGENSVSKCTIEKPTFDNLALENPDIGNGGCWKPTTCIPRDSVAIIIPYRNRRDHLLKLLCCLLPMLKRQQLEYELFVVEQIGNGTFNKGRLMNSGYTEAKRVFNFQCVIFHDVDLLPENDRNMYSCPTQPTHLSPAVDEMNYKLRYELLVGGVLNMRKEQFELVNGYSNEYWGWGGEDDDMAYRILLSGLRILRPPITIARYKMLRHKKRQPSAWIERKSLLRKVNKNYLSDGLSRAKYTVMSVKRKHLFTHIMVDVGNHAVPVTK